MSLLQMSIQGGIFIILIIVIRSLWLNKIPKSAFIVMWEIAIARLLLPIKLPVIKLAQASPESTQSIQTVGGGAVFSQNGIGITLPAAPSITTDSVAAPAHIGTLTVIWLAGAVICSLYFVIAYLRCRGEFRTALPIKSEFISSWLDEHKLRRTVTVRRSEAVSSPITYGIINPIILLPKNIDLDNEHRLKLILMHEYAHIRRFDSVLKFVSTAALCIHWFNPLVWMMQNLLSRDIELRCDESVLRELGIDSRADYALALIELEEKRSGLSPIGSGFAKSAVEERITAIMKFKSTTVLSVVLAIAFIAAIAVTVFATASLKDESNTDIPDSDENSLIVSSDNQISEEMQAKPDEYYANPILGDVPVIIADSTIVNSEDLPAGNVILTLTGAANTYMIHNVYVAKDGGEFKLVGSTADNSIIIEGFDVGTYNIKIIGSSNFGVDAVDGIAFDFNTMEQSEYVTVTIGNSDPDSVAKGIRAYSAPHYLSLNGSEELTMIMLHGTNILTNNGGTFHFEEGTAAQIHMDRDLSQLNELCVDERFEFGYILNGEMFKYNEADGSDPTKSLEQDYGKADKWGSMITIPETGDYQFYIRYESATSALYLESLSVKGFTVEYTAPPIALDDDFELILPKIDPNIEYSEDGSVTIRWTDDFKGETGWEVGFCDITNVTESYVIEKVATVTEMFYTFTDLEVGKEYEVSIRGVSEDKYGARIPESIMFAVNENSVDIINPLSKFAESIKSHISKLIEERDELNDEVKKSELDEIIKKLEDAIAALIKQHSDEIE